MENHVVSLEEEKKAAVGKICRKKGFKSGMRERVGYHTFLFFSFLLQKS